MKPTTRLLILVFLAGCLIAAPVTAVRASPLSELTPSTEAEEYLLEDLRATGYADLKEDFAEQADRVIGGDFLVAALQDPQVQSHPALYIANVSVAGELWASDLVMPANLDFNQVEFEGFVSFDRAELQAFIIANSTFHDSLSIARATLDGDVDMRNNLIEESLSFYGTHVTGELLLDGSEVLGIQAMSGTSHPVEFWLARVDGVASFLDVHFGGSVLFAQSSFNRLEMVGAAFDGDADFSEASVAHTLDLSDAQFSGDADFKNIIAGNTARFNRATFNGLANFQNASVVSEADFSDAVFNGQAIFDYFTAERFIDFYRTTFNQGFSFYYTAVTWPYFENVAFNGPVSFEGMHVSEDFELVDTRYNYLKEPFSVYLAEVEGAVKFTRLTAPAGLQLSDSHFGSLSINTKDQPEIAFIDLTATDIDGQFSIENVMTKSFLAEGVSIGKSTTLTNITITDKLDLRNASIGFLKIDDQPDWPDNPQAFNLRGMTYTDIDLGNQGLTDETWQQLLELMDQSAYSPQSYQALGLFLTDKGHPDWAAEVDLAQKRRERNESLTPLSGAWFWSWFLDIFAGYGHRPALAFIWSGLVITIGAFVFRRKEDMLPVEQDDARVEYNPLWYSFALFLPYIDLGIASKWEPNPCRKWARNYKYIHMILGWVLAPIALLTFGGIIG